ncbi:hypothetical protein ACJX0J_019556, partial [Zea mays]
MTLEEEWKRRRRRRRRPTTDELQYKFYNFEAIVNKRLIDSSRRAISMFYLSFYFEILFIVCEALHYVGQVLGSFEDWEVEVAKLAVKNSFMVEEIETLLLSACIWTKMLHLVMEESTATRARESGKVFDHGHCDRIIFLRLLIWLGDATLSIEALLLIMLSWAMKGIEELAFTTSDGPEKDLAYIEVSKLELIDNETKSLKLAVL